MVVGSLLLVALAAATPPASQNACALLADGDIQAALGDTVTQRTAVRQPAGGLLMNQCQFATSGSHGVSLAVAEAVASGGSSIAPREYWRRQFHGKEATESKESKERESPPRKIAGLGDDAYWAGGPVTGALYVLRGQTFVRVSVGGLKTESERLEKSKLLARAAIQRLRVP